MVSWAETPWLGVLGRESYPDWEYWRCLFDFVTDRGEFLGNGVLILLSVIRGAEFVERARQDCRNCPLFYAREADGEPNNREGVSCTGVSFSSLDNVEYPGTGAELPIAMIYLRLGDGADWVHKPQRVMMAVNGAIKVAQSYAVCMRELKRAGLLG